MRTTVIKEVNVIKCDFCGEETEHPKRCAVCKREGCSLTSGKAHFAYALDFYRYRDRERRHVFACTECAAVEANPGLTIEKLFDGMISPTKVLRRI